MKNFTILPVLLFLLLMLAYQCSRAQDFVVTIKRDTLRGEVKALLYGNEKKVQVTTSDDKKTVLPITQTLGYSYKGETYHPVRGESGYVFMKLLKSGYLSLYAFQMENQVTFDGLYMVKKDGSKVEVPNLNFKKIITKFVEDCKEVSTKIAEGVLKKKDLYQIIDEYNLCIDGKFPELTKPVVTQDQSKKISSWNILEEKLKAEPDFSGKKDALEMIAEVKNKISRSEKVPNFLVEGLKGAITQENLKADLDNALKEINN